MTDLLSSVLSAGEWLKAWDHVLTRGPRFLYAFMLAYLIHCRRVLALALFQQRPAARRAPLLAAAVVGRALRSCAALLSL
jgi:hypothetical protein